MIKKIVVDGNDGTGKTTRVEELSWLFPGVEIVDRGIFSEATLNEKLFSKNTIPGSEEEINFYNKIWRDKDTLYVIVDASPETCQKRILERGDSIDVEYHNMEDLIKYRERFLRLFNICKELTNVMLVNTD